MLWEILQKNNIEDLFSSDEVPIFSCDILRDDGIQVLVRLDRFYLFSS